MVQPVGSRMEELRLDYYSAGCKVDVEIRLIIRVGSAIGLALCVLTVSQAMRSRSVIRAG